MLFRSAILTTTTAHGFSIGDSIVVANIGEPFDGVYTTIAGTTGSTVRYSRTNANIASTATSGTVQSRGGSNSFHVSSSGQIWSGASTFAAATFKVTSGGSMTATQGSIAGWNLTSTEFQSGAAYINSTGTALFPLFVLTDNVGGYGAATHTGGATSATLKTKVDTTTIGFLRNISYGAAKPTTANLTVGDIHFS